MPWRQTGFGDDERHEFFASDDDKGSILQVQKVGPHFGTAVRTWFGVYGADPEDPTKYPDVESAKNAALLRLPNQNLPG